MEFGRAEPSAIRYIDFSLPADGRITSRTLPGDPSPSGCQFHVGLAKWGRKEWVGDFYPPNTRERDFLTEYAKRVDSIELNAAFYSIPEPRSVRRWKEQVDGSGNKNFLFFPKVSRSISHIHRLKDCGLLVKQFLEAMSELKEYQGPSFLQLSENFSSENYERLVTFLQAWPLGHKLFLEVRHASWYSDEIERGRLFDLLAKHEVGSVMSDASARRDCVHMELPTPELFIRFIGNGGHHANSDFARVDEWIDRILIWVEKGLEQVNFFCHQHDEVASHELGIYVTEQFNKRLDAGLREISLIR